MIYAYKAIIAIIIHEIVFFSYHGKNNTIPQFQILMGEFQKKKTKVIKKNKLKKKEAIKLYILIRIKNLT